ncbi:MAG: DUF4221 domain-containing protein [Clostridium sp.]|nr:DUF4221 domain-containing protein [Clostridium sp.]
MKILSLLFCLLSFILTSCNEGKYSVINNGIPASDSVSLQRIDTITLHIGNRIKPIPTCSQLLEDSISAKYIILDEQKLNIFDLDSDSLTAVIDVHECGSLTNYSGFTCAKDGRTFIYNYGSKTFFIVEADGSISKSYPMPEYILKHVSPEPIDGSHILVGNETAVLSGLPLSDKSRFSPEDPISVSIDLKTGDIIAGTSFSEEYTKAFFGGLYFNTIYQCQGDSNKIVYSFPASNYIYRYDTDLNLIDSLYMGSRYTKEINSYNSSPIEILSDKDKRLDYYVSEHSYSVVTYDEYNGLYYRIANHPRITNRKDNYRTPFSIIVMDKEGNLVTETPIVDDYLDIVTLNCHIFRGGLLMQKVTEDENEIQFIYYKLNR